MRGSVLGSGIVHIGLLAALLIVRGPMAMVIPGPDVVQVALLDPNAPIGVPPPPEEKPEPPKLDEVQPVEEEGVKIEQKKPKPKASPKPKEERAPVKQVALPSAPAGSSGLRGDVATEGDFEFTYYLVLIRNKIAANWTPPAGLTTSGNPVRAVLFFRVGRGGELTDVRLETPSGVEFFDRSAQRAVVLSDPLPPLPLGFTGGSLGVHFGFEWESP
jgi:TonB family protein